MTTHETWMPNEQSKMGWWTISGEGLLEMLRRVADGEDPDILYAEEYANAEITKPADE